MTNADLLREFHAAVGSPVPKSPELPAPVILALRRTLIAEEYEEVLSAFGALEIPRR